MTKKRGDERIRLEAELREEPQVLARAVALLKDRAQLLLDLAAQTLARVVGPLAHDATHVLRVERVAVPNENKQKHKQHVRKQDNKMSERGCWEEKWRERESHCSRPIIGKNAK